jgi:hypothetical protein
MFSASMMFHCIASIYYADSSFTSYYLSADSSFDWAEYLELSLIVTNLGVVAIAAGLYIMSLLEDKFKAAAVTGLAGGVANLIVSLQLEMRGQAQSLLRTLDEATRAIPPLAKGCRVSHPTNGLGVVIAVVLDDARGKPHHVMFDSGERRHYSAESASKKLQAFKDRGDAPEDAVLLDEFQQGVQRCLQSHHISPAALEALFLMLKFLDAEENAEVYTTQAWVSMRLVSISATSGPFRSDFARSTVAGSRIPRRAAIIKKKQVSSWHYISSCHGQAALEACESIASRSRCTAERCHCARTRLSASGNGVEQFACQEDDAQALRRDPEFGGAGCVPKMDAEKSRK